MDAMEKVTKVVIVGGGYASLCLLDALASASSTNASYSVQMFQTEDFVNRPAIFFKLKFPEKIAPYGLKDPAYYERVRCDVQTRRVVAIDRAQKCVWVDDSSLGDPWPLPSTLARSKDENTERIEYDLLVVATGGTPYVLRPSILVEPFEPMHPSLVHAAFIMEHVELSPLVYDLAVDPSVNAPVVNALAVRNVAEVESLARVLLAESPSTILSVDHPIVIVGGGTLALDLVTSMLEGGKVAKIVMLVRGRSIGASLVDETGQCILLQQVSTFRPGVVDVRFEEELDALFVSPLHSFDADSSDSSSAEAKSFWATRLRTKSGTVMNCGCVIYALGVHPNSTLAQQAGLQLGEHGGVLCKASDSGVSVTDSFVFVCGDCAEIVDPFASFAHNQPVSQVWRNWNMARETALRCAAALAPRLKIELKESPATENSHILVFSQNLKLFHYYIYCTGAYREAASDWITLGERGIARQRVVVQSETTAERHLRLVLVHLELDESVIDGEKPSTDAWVLIGAQIMGTSPSDHRLGMNLHRCIKMARRLPVPSAEGSEWTRFDWDAWLKQHRKSVVPDKLVLSWIDPSRFESQSASE